MSTICALVLHIDNEASTLECFRALVRQTRQPDYIVIAAAGSFDESLLLEDVPYDGAVHIVRVPQQVPSVEGYALGLDKAFRELGVDAVWVLDTLSRPHSKALAELVAVDVAPKTVPVCLLENPDKAGELSFPLALEKKSDLLSPWKNIHTVDGLPKAKVVPCRGGWLGALYPRAAWQQVGVPRVELFVNGMTEEYPWKVRGEGFRFVTVPAAVLYHPSTSATLVHYSFAGRSFFYEPGLSVERSYYKNRNWAWLKRLRARHHYGRRLVACGLYILLSLSCMLRFAEMSPKRVYNLFRALHNGFYGKLRPY